MDTPNFDQDIQTQLKGTVVFLYSIKRQSLKYPYGTIDIWDSDKSYYKDHNLEVLNSWSEMICDHFCQNLDSPMSYKLAEFAYLSKEKYRN